MAPYLPPEVLTLILSKCDGITLLRAKSISNEWRDLVHYVEKKTRIWEWCCREEIPPKELCDFISAMRCTKPIGWAYLYESWLSWKRMSECITFETVVCPVEIPRVTCMDVSGGYIAVGAEDGRFRIFNKYWRQLYTTLMQAEKITKVTFFNNSADRQDVESLSCVIAYPKFLLFRNHAFCTIVEDVQSHSIFNEHIFYQRSGGRLTVEKLIPRNHYNRELLRFVWFARIYSPSNITCLHIWNGVCTILVDDVVSVVYYVPNYLDRPPTAPAMLERRCRIGFSFVNCPTTNIRYQIFRDDTIVVLFKEDTLGGCEYMEIAIMENDNTYASKLFNTTEALSASVTCLTLFGNMLALGVDRGCIFLYHMSDWKLFNVREYHMSIVIGRHPITNIVVKESTAKRILYITSSFCIHELHCYYKGLKGSLL